MTIRYNNVIKVNMWMTPEGTAQYLKVSVAKVYQLIREKKIPFHNNHGFLRFYKEEVDDWMRTPDEKPAGAAGTPAARKVAVAYRGRSIFDYSLTASKILVGTTAWSRLPEFIANFINEAGKAGGTLRRENVLEINKNAYDYLRISYQLGLVNKRDIGGRIKEYCPSEILTERKNGYIEAGMRSIVCDSDLTDCQGE